MPVQAEKYATDGNPWPFFGLTAICLVYIMIYTVTHTAKLFRNGRSQAVRLPSAFRFEGSEVYVRRDPENGNVILSRRPESWKDFFQLVKTLEVPSDFLTGRRDSPPQKRSLF
ncbi:MAG: antitoxin [Terriglobales bacterium]